MQEMMQKMMQNPQVMGWARDGIRSLMHLLGSPVPSQMASA